MSLWSKIAGTIESVFQLGLGGPKIKNASGAVEARNSADNAYVVVRGADPVGNNDLTTRKWVETIATPTIVTALADCSVALPASSGIEHFIVVSVTGSGAVVGDLLYDDASTVTIISAAARMIVTTVALVGGSINMAADSPYIWDTNGSTWVAAGPSGVSGAIREIRFNVALATPTDSATSIPANAVVTETTLDVGTGYTGGTTISIGKAGGSATLLQATTDNLATVVGTYQSMQNVDWGAGSAAVRVTIVGGPAVGVAKCIVKYTMHDA